MTSNLYFKRKDKLLDNVKANSASHSLPPVGLVLLTLIIPPNPEKAASILQQLKLFLAYYSRLKTSHLHLLVLTDYVDARDVISQSGLISEEFTVELIKKHELRFVQGRDKEEFELAFAKIDAVIRSESLLRSRKSLKALVVTDVDTIFTNTSAIVKACLDVRNMMAINYRLEQETTELFDQAMQAISIDSKWENCSDKFPKSWINSGFMVMNKDFVLALIEENDFAIRSANMDQYAELIKRGCDNHFGDELLFSSLFSDIGGQEIPLYDSKLAQLIWTCRTKMPTFRLINLLFPPAHLHLPAIKWSPDAMTFLITLSNQRYGILKSIIALNHWSIHAHFGGNYVVAYFRAFLYCLWFRT